MNIKPILEHVDTYKNNVEKRLVVVQLRHHDTGLRVTFASYHGFNRIHDTENHRINVGLLRGLLWMSSFRRNPLS